MQVWSQSPLFVEHSSISVKVLKTSVKKEKPWARLVDYTIHHDLNVSDLFRLVGSTDDVSIHKDKVNKTEN
jgi:hypothetical protein